MPAYRFANLLEGSAIMEALQLLGTLGITAANVAIVLLFLNYLTHRDRQLSDILQGVREELQKLNKSRDG